MLITLTIPAGAELVINKGQKITFGDELYRKRRAKEIIINVARRFGIKPSSIFNYLTKVIGEPVKKTDLLAAKKEFLSVKKLFAEQDGRLKNVNHATGEITLEIDNRDTDVVHSYFTGTVEEIGKDKLKVTIAKGLPFELNQCSNDWGGASFYFESPDLYFSVSEEIIKNKVIIAEKLTRQIAAKCEALGALGFACLMEDNDADLPLVLFKKLEDYQQIAGAKKKHILFSVQDKIAVIYD